MKKLTRIMLMAMMLITLTVIMAACFGYVTPTEKTYTITWKNYDGTVLETDENVKEGTTPSYNSETPVRANDSEYTYTFAGWEPEIVKVTKDAVYTAKFDATAIVIPVKTYTITWVNYDGTILETDEKVEEGTMPTYDGETPVREADATYSYTFAGWEPTVVAASADAKYTAKYDATIIEVASIGLEFKLNREGNGYIVTGIGTCTDVDLVIPSVYEGKPVVQISEGAFTSCTVFSSVKIPGSVISLEWSAFSNCSNLNTVILAEGTKEIGGSAFNNCINLQNINIPESVTSIVYAAFYNCTKLATIPFTGNIEKIGTFAFFGTQWYKDQPDGIIYVDKVLYLYKGTMPANTTIDVKEGTKFIGETAFQKCNGLVAVNFPESLEGIGYNAFANCTGLVSIKFNNNLKEINRSAFNGCSNLDEITFPENVLVYGYAFNNTAWLKKQPEGPLYIGKSLYLYNGIMPDDTNFVIKDGTVVLADDSLSCCDTMISVSIPASVKYIGDNCFADCTSLKSVVIPEGVLEINGSAFYGCESLTDVKLPSSLISIYDNAFECCTNLVTITIPDNVTYVGWSTFSECTALESVILPAGLTTVSDSIFYNCTALLSVTMPDSVTIIEDNAFAQCANLPGITLSTNLETIGYCAFSYCQRLEKIYIPDSVKSIGENAFEHCSGMKSVEISDNVEEIFGLAFSYCSGLTSIKLPSKITCIDEGVLRDCISLTTIIIPENVKEIIYKAFYNCSKLQSIVIPEKCTLVDDYAFYNCSNLTVVYYMGATVEKWNSIYFGEESMVTSPTVYYYSETSKAGCWHFVEGKPELWA